MYNMSWINIVTGMFPELRYKLRAAHLQVHPRDYIRQVISQTLIFSVLISFSVFLFSKVFSVSLFGVLLLFVISFLFFLDLCKKG